jgi:hypothetical protein
VPSTNELAAFYRINPATAAKGINMLVDGGVLAVRRKLFAEQYVGPMVAEASRLGIDNDTLVSLVREASVNDGGKTR